MRFMPILCICTSLLMPLTAHAAGTSSSGGASDKSEYSYTSSAMKAANKLIKAKDYIAAAKTLNTEVMRNLDDADAWNLLGFSLRKSGQFAEAEVAYETALSLDPKHTRAMEYMGELYLSLNQVEKAEALLARLNALCSFNCKDRDMLKKAIAAYKAN